MAFLLSTGLATALAGTDSLKSALDGGEIRVYSGAVPNSADGGIGAAVLLCTFLLDGTDPLEFEHTGTMVRKPTGDTWSGDAVATGTASFFRVVQSGDTDGTSTSDKRAQGTIGMNNSADMVLQDVGFTSGLNRVLHNAVFAIPLHK